MPRVVLLGPQRFEPTLSATLRSVGVEGDVAVITSGWQEREGEDDELREHLGCAGHNLELYARHEDVLERDQELAAALRERQEQLQQIQQLYRLRLDCALDAARQLMAQNGRGPFLEEHRRAAIRAVRTIDRQHLRQLQGVHAAFEERWSRRPAVTRHREQVAALLEQSEALAIAGGHVAVLLNRMRLFDLRPMLRGGLVLAWSAGAMALAERVVLFHDGPPQGPGNAEVLDAGLAWCRKIVALPHARRRLRLDDPVRVALLARRFSPATCAVLDGGARLDWDGRSWHAGPRTRRLARTGKVRRMSA